MLTPESSSSSTSSIIISALEDILQGKKVETNKFLKILSSAKTYLEGKPLLQNVSGDTLIIGPCRGHATDLSHYLIKNVLGKSLNDQLNIIFLGDYIDGSHQSVEVLYIVSLMIIYLPNVIPLIGRHEMFYPFPSGGFGSLKGELRLRSLEIGISLNILEDSVKEFFAKLPVVCIINQHYFCSSGGIASEYRLLDEIAQETLQLRLSEFVRNQPMDEDEDRLAVGCAFTGSQTETGNCFKYTFNAVSNFLSRNNLYTHIGGLEYHMYRPEFESFVRPNHYRESTYFPGWVLGRARHELRVPSYILIFSAPHFAGVNQNYGCTLLIVGNTLKLRQFGPYVKRPLIMPGEENHVFSWSQEILKNSLGSIFNGILYGDIKERVKEENDDDPGFTQMAQNVTSRYRRMCQLLKNHSLPLPH